MDRKKGIVGLASILSTLRETGGGSEGIMYSAMMERYSLPEFQALIRCLAGSGLIKVSGNYAALTDRGREAAEQIDAAAGL